MGSTKATILKISAYIGWGATVAILALILFEADMVIEKDFFFSRLFALTALASSVITLGLWFEYSRARNVIPAEEAWKAGVQYGVSWRRFDAGAANEMLRFLQQPANGDGPQESPPIMWPPR